MTINMAIFREPLVQFMIAGGLLFGLYALIAPSKDPTKIIPIENSTEQQLKNAFEARWKKPPNADELNQLIDNWVVGEVLLREGLALDIQRSDGTVREIIVSKMRSILKSSIVLAEPSNEDLKSWYNNHQDRYQIPESLNFEQYLVNKTDPQAKQKFTQLFATLQKNPDASPEQRLFRYKQREPDWINRLYGQSFTAALRQLPLNHWSVLESDQNVHIVRVQTVNSSRVPSMKELGDQLITDWREDQRHQHYQRALQQLQAGYVIEREGLL